MTLQEYQYERDVAVAAVREAARLCEAVRAQIGPGVIEKQDRSPVTVADFGSQALVCRMVRDAFPDDPIIAEEDATSLRQNDHAGLLDRVVRHVQAERPEADQGAVLDWIDAGNAQTYSDRFWTLDPIDGTKGFLRGDQYAVALALVVEGKVQVAALACPRLTASCGAGGSVYAAIRGFGAVQLSLDGSGEEVPVRVSTLSEVQQARFCESVESAHSSHDDTAALAEWLGITAHPVRLDSQAKYALVARGDADIYLRIPRHPGYVEKIWDHAAGTLLVTEAGGTVTDAKGASLAFNQGWGLKSNLGIVVSNGLLHDRMIEALQAVCEGCRRQASHGLDVPV